MNDEPVKEPVAESGPIKRARKIANASFIFGFLSLCLLWLSLLGPSIEDQWHPPFVARLIPLFYLPKVAGRMLALLLALMAILAGHTAIMKGRRAGAGGLPWISLLLAIVAYLAVPLMLPWALSFAGQLSELSGFFFIFLLGGLFVAPAAFVVVHIALVIVGRVPGKGGLSWRSLSGSIIGYVNVVVIVLMVMSFLGKGRHNLDMWICGTNLNVINKLLHDHGERKALCPPLSSQPGVLMFAADAFPDKDLAGQHLTCPTMRFAQKPTTGPATPFDDQSYFYLGYAVLNDDDVEAFAQAYRKKIAEGGTFEEDLVVESGGKRRVLHRLGDGVERKLSEEVSTSPVTDTSRAATDLMGKIPILIERDFGHINVDYPDIPLRVPGAFVLYLHGDIGFVERGTWPLTEKTQRILAELAESPPPK